MIIIISVVGVLVLAVFASVAVSVNRATRLNRPRPYPEPTFEGSESPAVVNMLVNGWTVTSDAAAATLVNLTAQEYAVIEGGTARPLRHGSGLKAYEQLVLDRLAAVQHPAAGAAPLGALMFRGLDTASRWLAVPDPSPAYATALGRTPELAAALPFSQADRRTLSSSYGGRWHRVYVSYPPDKFPYGISVFRLLWTAGLMMLLGGGAGIFLLTHIFELNPHTSDTFSRYVTYFFDLVCVAGFVVAIAGLRIAVRTVLDIASVQTVSGQVQWVQAWRRNSHPDDSEPGPPWLYYVAIDDGRNDHTTAWGLPDKLKNGVTEGVVITIRARTWSRRILEVVHEQ